MSLVLNELGKPKSILVVDDDRAIRDLAIQILELKYQVYSATDAIEARRIALEHKPSLILLDIYMAGESGISLCERLRKDPQTQDIPLILMTARSAREVRVNAFTSGADDFIEKPFYMDELLARIDSKLRRSNEHKKGSESTTTYTYQDIKLDLETQKMSLMGQSTDISQTEFRVMCLLVRRSGELVKREDIEALIWENEKPITRSLDTHMAALRKILRNSSAELRAVYGQGYILDKRSNPVSKRIDRSPDG